MYRTQIASSTLVILALIYAFVFWDRMALASMVANSWQGWKLTQGMVGYWSFDGQDMNWATQRALDKSGQGNNGTLTNMSTTTSPAVGKMGQSLSFDGSNDRVRVANQASLGITADITMSAWVKRNQIDEYHAIITKSDGAAWDYGFFIFYDSPGHADNNKLNFYTTGSGSNLSTGKITDTNWHHVAVTRLGSNGTFYIDGTAAGTFTLAGALANNSFPVEIGWDGSTGQVDGTLDDIRVYNRALSADEVKRLYLMGNSMVKNASQNSKLTQGLRALLAFYKSLHQQLQPCDVAILLWRGEAGFSHSLGHKRTIVSWQ